MGHKQRDRRAKTINRSDNDCHDAGLYHSRRGRNNLHYDGRCASILRQTNRLAINDKLARFDGGQLGVQSVQGVADDMNYRSVKNWCVFLYRMCLSILAAFSVSVGLSYLSAVTTEAHDLFEYDAVITTGHNPVEVIDDSQYNSTDARYLSIDATDTFVRGDDIRFLSVYKVYRNGLRINFKDNLECIYPSGQRDMTEYQHGQGGATAVTFSGYPNNVVPDGFKPEQRRDDASTWPYSWRVSDVPPAGSKCRLHANPFTTLFYFVPVRHPVIYSNWFMVI